MSIFVSMVYNRCMEVMEETAIRQLGRQDVPQMRDLFRETVLNVNARDYTSEEVEDWASCGESEGRWEELLAGNEFVGAFDGRGVLTGFASMDKNGHLHSMFVHKDFQRRGIGTRLLGEVERIARRNGAGCITSEVSLTARPFFERMGYETVKVQKARARRLELTNFVMRKRLECKYEGLFRPIDRGTWKRAPYFEHYFNKIRCTYSITVDIDISDVIAYKEKNHTKLYPLLIYAVAKAVNGHEEFRTVIDDRGEPGIWETVSPCYTVFHKEDGSFSNVWTEWNDDLRGFLEAFGRDMEVYGENSGIDAKPSAPPNTFPISSLPWETFTGFNLNIFADGSYLLPIFTFGKYFHKDGRCLIPLAVQVHHAVCDGFHVSRLIEDIRRICRGFGERAQR